MCNGDDNPPDVMTVTRPKARKSHRCDECGLPVPPGTVYVRTWGIWDREPHSYVQHAECLTLLDWISETFCGGESWTFGSLQDELGEYGPKLYPETDPAYPDVVMAHAWMAAIRDQYAPAREER